MIHTKTIPAAIAGEGRKGEIRHYGTIENPLEATDKYESRKLFLDVHHPFIHSIPLPTLSSADYLVAAGLFCRV